MYRNAFTVKIDGILMDSVVSVTLFKFTLNKETRETSKKIFQSIQISLIFVFSVSVFGYVEKLRKIGIFVTNLAFSGYVNFLTLFDLIFSTIIRKFFLDF